MNATSKLVKVLQECKKEKPSPDLIDFVCLCCVFEPEKRPTTEELLKHSFITKFNNMDKIEPLIACLDLKDAVIPPFEEVVSFFNDKG